MDEENKEMIKNLVETLEFQLDKMGSSKLPVIAAKNAKRFFDEYQKQGFTRAEAIELIKGMTISANKN